MTTNGNEPLVKLWIERNRLLKLANAADEKVKSRNDAHEIECDALQTEASAIEGRIANTAAETVQGLLVQIRLHYDVVGDGTWTRGDALMVNVIASLERMEAAS